MIKNETEVKITYIPGICLFSTKSAYESRIVLEEFWDTSWRIFLSSLIVCFLDGVVKIKGDKTNNDLMVVKYLHLHFILNKVDILLLH